MPRLIFALLAIAVLAMSQIAYAGGSTFAALLLLLLGALVLWLCGYELGFTSGEKAAKVTIVAPPEPDDDDAESDTRPGGTA